MKTGLVYAGVKPSLDMTIELCSITNDEATELAPNLICGQETQATDPCSAYAQGSAKIKPCPVKISKDKRLSSKSRWNRKLNTRLALQLVHVDIIRVYLEYKI